MPEKERSRVSTVIAPAGEPPTTGQIVTGASTRIRVARRFSDPPPCNGGAMSVERISPRCWESKCIDIDVFL